MGSGGLREAQTGPRRGLKEGRDARHSREKPPRFLLSAQFVRAQSSAAPEGPTAGTEQGDGVGRARACALRNVTYRRVFFRKRRVSVSVVSPRFTLSLSVSEKKRGRVPFAAPPTRKGPGSAAFRLSVAAPHPFSAPSDHGPSLLQCACVCEERETRMHPPRAAAARPLSLNLRPRPRTPPDWPFQALSGQPGQADGLPSRARAAAFRLAVPFARHRRPQEAAHTAPQPPFLSQPSHLSPPHSGSPRALPPRPRRPGPRRIGPHHQACRRLGRG